eukprot:gene6472-4735_t
MTDGDNVQWLLNDFFTGSKWLGAAEVGQAPLGFTISPALAALAPAAL